MDQTKAVPPAELIPQKASGLTCTTLTCFNSVLVQAFYRCAGAIKEVIQLLAQSIDLWRGGAMIPSLIFNANSSYANDKKRVALS